MFEWAEVEARRIGRPVEDLLREKLRDYHDRRLRLEQLAGGECRLNYGALNVGGIESGRGAKARHASLLETAPKIHERAAAVAEASYLKACERAGVMPDQSLVDRVARARQAD